MVWTGSTGRGPRDRSTWVGGASNVSESHARDIALRRRAEQATVLATELRRAFVPHTPARAARVEVLVQHQLPCFLQTQLLLVLQWAHAREGAEMLPEGRWAHVRAIRQIVPVQRLREVLLEPGDRLRNLLAWGPSDGRVDRWRRAVPRAADLATVRRGLAAPVTGASRMRVTSR
jgi:hypothetical protein